MKHDLPEELQINVISPQNSNMISKKLINETKILQSDNVSFTDI
jgi:hypothetical protein